MDEATRLRNWLARGASQTALDELDDRFAEAEGISALLGQQAQMRRVRELLGSQPCSCRKFPSGARLVKCAARSCRGHSRRNPKRKEKMNESADRDLALALANARDDEQMLEAENVILDRLDVDLSETEQGLTPAAVTIIETFVSEQTGTPWTYASLPWTQTTEGD